MLARLVCSDRECRAAFEAEGTRASIEALRCEDCGGPLQAVAYADSQDSGASGGTRDLGPARGLSAGVRLAALDAAIDAHYQPL